MENLPALSETITFSQMVAGTWSIPDEHYLREVRAEDEFGTVRVWSSHQTSWFWAGNDTQLHTTNPESFDLLVRGAPKSVATRLVTDKTFDRGLFEAPVLITLAQGINWAHQWDQGERSAKAEVLNQLSWMKERASRCLDYDRYHFSTVPIEALLNIIDEAIKERNWPAFVVNIENLYGQKHMKFDPYTGSFGPESS